MNIKPWQERMGHNIAAVEETFTTDAMQAEINDLRAELQRIAAQEPVAHEFQSRDGRWCPFIDQKHYESTVFDGTWPIRPLYLAAGAKE